MDIAQLYELLVTNPYLLYILTAVARSFMGWAENCSAAKRIIPFEFGKLFETAFRMAPEAAGLTALGVPVVAALPFDFLINALKKLAINMRAK